jgi:UDP-GlcNAc:undecaprenyl-phosphate GlcNAc-1-phosphate transferase
VQLYVIWYIATFAGACVLALVLTREARGAATRLGLVDVPDGGRRRHLRTVPRGGGIPLFIAVSAVLFLVRTFGPYQLEPLAFEAGPTFGTLVLGGIAMLVLGFIDDVRGLSARSKFLVEVAIAIALFAGGLRIDVLNLGFAAIQFNTALSLIVTVLWVVGLTNAFNLIDGSDGVAGGAAVFAALALALVAALSGDGLGAAIALAIAGATFGFLFYNFPPASIFLGDSGSLFLGYSLAALGVLTAQKAPTMLAVAIPVVSCGLPILDVCLTIARRFLRGGPLFTGDRGHIHHRLLDLGHSPRQVALLLYAVSGTFALLSLLLVQPARASVAVVFGVAGIIVYLAIHRLRIPELLELHRVLDRGRLQRAVIMHNMRVREAATSLQGIRSVLEIERVLSNCFAESEFERVELHWSGEAPRNTVELIIPPNRERTNGSLPAIRSAAVTHQEETMRQTLWEISLPFRDSQGRRTGALTLWPADINRHLLTDVRLVAAELKPALQAALESICAPDEIRVPAPDRRLVSTVGVAQAS